MRAASSTVSSANRNRTRVRPGGFLREAAFNCSGMEPVGVLVPFTVRRGAEETALDYRNFRCGDSPRRTRRNYYAVG